MTTGPIVNVLNRACYNPFRDPLARGCRSIHSLVWGRPLLASCKSALQGPTRSKLRWHQLGDTWTPSSWCRSTQRTCCMQWGVGEARCQVSHNQPLKQTQRGINLLHSVTQTRVNLLHSVTKWGINLLHSVTKRGINLLHSVTKRGMTCCTQWYKEKLTCCTQWHKEELKLVALSDTNKS